MSAQASTAPGCKRREGRTKSPERLAVERVLQAAAEPITTHEIATVCKLPRTTVTEVMGTLRKAGLVRRAEVADTTQAYFEWQGPATGGEVAAAPAEDAPGVAERRTYPTLAEIYDGRDLRAFAGRPGAMDAYQLPSIHNGQRVERRAPVLMASSATLADRRLP